MGNFITSIKKFQIWHRKLNFCSLFDLKTVQTKWRTQKGYLLVLFVIIMCFNESLYDLGHGKKVFLQSKTSWLSTHWLADAQILPLMLARLYLKYLNMMWIRFFLYRLDCRKGPKSSEHCTSSTVLQALINKVLWAHGYGYIKVLQGVMAQWKVTF